jgi:UMF1 family MFS transporter
MSFERKRQPSWKLYVSLPVLSWALYDFANTIFSSNINTIFFPLYVSETVGKSENLNQIASTFISYANALASFFLVVFSPLYGTWIDQTRRRKNGWGYLQLFRLRRPCLWELPDIRIMQI